MGLQKLRILFLIPLIGMSSFKSKCCNSFKFDSNSNVILPDETLDFIDLTNTGNKPKRKQQRRGGKKSKSPEGVKMLNLDLFIGPSMNLASGNFVEFQKEYYETGSTLFPTEVKTTDFYWVNAGGQLRVNPFLESNPILSYLGFAFGLNYFQRGYASEFVMQNLSLKYLDQTSIKESYRTNYIGSSLMIRFGNRLYAEAGASLDWLLFGKKTFELSRFSFGEESYDGEFSTGQTSTENLDSKIIKSGGLGWCFSLGFNFTDYVGIRAFANTNSTFFKEGANLTNQQFSLQAAVTIK